MTARAIQITKVSRRLLVECNNPMTLIDLPPDPWFVRGPRGGLYVATGERERFINEYGDDYLTNFASIIDRSEGIRYVRPGSRLAKEAAE